MLTKPSNHQLYGDEIILSMQRAGDNCYAVWPDGDVCDLADVHMYHWKSDDYIIKHSSMSLEEFEETLYQ